eukprot:m.76382 g.76382  ORF g.76382 m.76382 type:complete len:602 (+) comp11878_c0_seq1:40-1845(+)
MRMSLQRAVVDCLQYRLMSTARTARTAATTNVKNFRYKETGIKHKHRQQHESRTNGKEKKTDHQHAKTTTNTNNNTSNTPQQSKTTKSHSSSTSTTTGKKWPRPSQLKVFPINPRIKKVLEEDYSILSPNTVQQHAWAPIVEGESVLLTSQTGTGKTLAYALPITQKLFKDNFPRFSVLCLVPTRELAIQVQGVFQSLVKYIIQENQEKIEDENDPSSTLDSVRLKREGNFVHCIAKGITGSTTSKQIRKLEREEPSVIVATPKQLLEVFKDFPIYDEFKVVVLDEADKLLDPLPKHASEKKRMNREKKPKPACSIMDLLVYQRVMTAADDRRLFQHLAKEKQLICASASLTASVKREMIQRGWVHPKRIKRVSLSDGRTLPEGLAHYIVDEDVCSKYNVSYKDGKMAADQGDALFDQLCWTLHTLSPRTALVFVPTSVPVTEVVGRLQVELQQKIADMRRTQVVEDVESGPSKSSNAFEANVLALYDHVHSATSGFDALSRRKEMVDLFTNATKDSMTVGVVSVEAVRGIDIPQVDVACMVGTPRTPSDYLHAVGRVARNNVAGIAVTLAYDSMQKARIHKFVSRLNAELLPLHPGKEYF